MNTEPHWVYILLCKNGNYYTGYTNNLERRYQEHISGTGKCKYTRSFKPLKMVQSWQFPDKKSAMRIERLIKKMSKVEKIQLIENPNALAKCAKISQIR